MTETVEVAVESEDAPPVDTGDTVVVTAPTADNGNDLAIGEALGSLSVVVAGLVETVNALATRLDGAQQTAEVAVEVASDAVDIALDAEANAEEAAAEAEESAEDDKEVIEPDREHWLWKKRGGLKATGE